MEFKKKMVFSVIALGVMLIVMELGLAFVLKFVPSSQKQASESRLSSSIFMNSEWSNGYFEEFNSIKSGYRTFLGWAREEFHGEYINIDSTGMRATWNPDDYNEEPSTIFVFGGSAIWGTGARDEFTIPSLISRHLNKGDLKFKVYNFGESGYSLSQEVIRLTLLLKEGNRPDFVIFYDGANDVYRAYQSGRADSIQNEIELEKKLKMSNLQKITSGIGGALKNNSNIITAAVRIRDGVMNSDVQFQEVAAHYERAELDKLARDVSLEYMKNHSLIRNLSAAYGFKYITLWQPSAFTKNNLTNEEMSSDLRISDDSLAYLYVKATEFVTGEALENFVDFSDVLNDSEGSLFFDFVHISEEGNDIVARAVLPLLN